MNKHSTYDIFVNTGVPRYTRIELPDQRLTFDSFLKTAGEHILIHGPSKTGKTTLWTSMLGEEKVIKIPCNKDMRLIDLYVNILDELNSYFEVSKNVSKDIKKSFTAEVKSKIPFLGAKIGGEVNKTKSLGSHEERLVRPPIGSRVVAKFLKVTKKFIVMENIHYANDDLKSDLAHELHNFSDYRCKWILVGVQHKADQLFVENRDLVGRLKEIQTGSFSKAQVNEILELGSRRLNINFTDNIKTRIFEESLGTGALVQDIAKMLCLLQDVRQTADSVVIIDQDSSVDRACEFIANNTKQVYVKLCDDIKKGGRADATTKKYEWFLKVIRDVSIPPQGLLNTEVFNEIVKMGHRSINQSSVTQGLDFINKLQGKRKIKSPVLEYDSEKKRLFLLDPYFRFALRWIPELLS